MTNDELQRVLDEQSAASEKMHAETGAPLVTVPRPSGMKTDKPDDQRFDLVIQAICTPRRLKQTLREQDLWELWNFVHRDFARFVAILKVLAKYGTGL